MEVIFDWLKGMVMFKVSNLNPNFYKTYFLELAIYHEKLKFSCFNSNGGQIAPKNDIYNEYTKKLEKYRLTFLNSNGNSKYSSFLDYDNLAALEVGYTNITICVLFVSFLIKNIGYKLFSRNFIIVVIILIVVQKVNRLIISKIVVEKIDRYLVKNQNIVKNEKNNSH